MTIRVPRQASISGQVLDPDGRPAARARVHWSPGGDFLLGLDVPEDEPGYALADAEGRFEIRGLKARTTGTLRAISATRTSMRLDGIRSGSAGIIMRFPEGVTISGRVEAPGGAVPKRFTVELEPLHRQNDPKQRAGWRNVLGFGRVPGTHIPMTDVVSARRTIETATGQFNVTGVGVGRYDLGVRTDDGRVGWVEDLEIVAGSPPTTCLVEIGRPSLRGRLIDADVGRPLSGVTVRLGFDKETPSVTTDSAGRFVFDYGASGRATPLIVPATETYEFGSFLVRPSAAKNGDVGDLRLQRRLEPEPPDIDIEFRHSPEGPLVDGGSAIAAAGLAKGDLVLSIAGRPVLHHSPFQAKRLLEVQCHAGCDIGVDPI